MSPDPKYGFVIYEHMWLYHPVHAPKGELFHGVDAICDRLERGWVDTPAKFGLPEVLAKVDCLPDFRAMSRAELQAWLADRKVPFAIRWGKEDLIQACIRAAME